MAAEQELLTEIHRAMINFNRRAERATSEILEATFVDSAPLFELLSTRNNQVIYGRRGTGKTHALKFLAQSVERRGEVPIYIDLRTVGSNGSIYNDQGRPLAERASVLILDVLNGLYSALFEIAVAAIDTAMHPEQVTARLDDFGNAIQTVQIRGDVEQESQETHSNILGGKGTVKLTVSKTPTLDVTGSKETASSDSSISSVKRSGREVVHLNFGNIFMGLKGLLDVLGSPKLWLLIDEWSEIPLELQPYLADLLRRTVLPLGEVTIKIAAIEHRSNFAIKRGIGEYIGLELGAEHSSRFKP